MCILIDPPIDIISIIELSDVLPFTFAIFCSIFISLDYVTITAISSPCTLLPLTLSSSQSSTSKTIKSQALPQLSKITKRPPRSNAPKTMNFQCKICQRFYCQRGTLQRHYRQMHHLSEEQIDMLLVKCDRRKPKTTSLSSSQSPSDLLQSIYNRMYPAGPGDASLNANTDVESCIPMVVINTEETQSPDLDETNNNQSDCLSKHANSERLSEFTTLNVFNIDPSPPVHTIISPNMDPSMSDTSSVPEIQIQEAPLEQQQEHTIVQDIFIIDEFLDESDDMTVLPDSEFLDA